MCTDLLQIDKRMEIIFRNSPKEVFNCLIGKSIYVFDKELCTNRLCTIYVLSHDNEYVKYINKHNKSVNKINESLVLSLRSCCI